MNLECSINMIEAIFVLKGILEMAAVEWKSTWRQRQIFLTYVFVQSLCGYVTVDHIVDCIY